MVKLPCRRNKIKNQTSEIRIRNVPIGHTLPLVLVAGPCVIESRDLCMTVAEKIKALSQSMGIPFIFKASYDKANRTSIHSFRGPGIDEGLRILEQVRDEFDIPILSDVHLPDQCPPAAQALDCLQIPAFLARQTDLIIAAARTGKPVNVKKAQFMAPDDMLNVCEKIRETGNNRIILTERGTSFGYHHLINDMRAIPKMRQLGCPVLFDATHSVQQPGAQTDRSGGERDMAAPLALAAVAAGADGLFLEVHPQPEKALSDAATMLTPHALEPLLPKALRIRQTILT